MFISLFKFYLKKLINLEIKIESINKKMIFITALSNLFFI